MKRSKRNFLRIWAGSALVCATVARGATVSVGTWVCNPGAAIRVPVTLEGATDLTGVSVTLSYDPQVVVFGRAEPGDLAGVFDAEFSVSGENAGTATATIFTLGGNVSEDVGGTVATFVFLARPGTAGQFSDVTVTKVELLEESGVRDATVDNPVSIRNGMIRVMAADAQTARMEEAQTVVADSRLGSLALSEGDGIQASDAGTPIVVDGAVTAPGAVVPVAAPDHGWATSVYTLLKTPTAGLGFASATNAAERLAVTERRANGISTYELVVSSVDGLAVLSLEDDLDASLQAYVRDCVGHPAGVDTVWVAGGASAVSMARAFGIRPAVFVAGDYAEATFAMPSLSVVAFDPAAGTITAVVEPGEGNSIAGSGRVTGVVEVLGSGALGDAMASVDRVEIDLSAYFKPDTAGEIRCRATFGDNRFFQVRIADE